MGGILQDLLYPTIQISHFDLMTRARRNKYLLYETLREHDSPSPQDHNLDFLPTTKRNYFVLLAPVFD
ncbi:MAG: hypothetical protein V7K25_19100 [Nostoc sp.]|uniref:hypothetical protein n=1 Tax=Nostoc sp. TaxID=1180 RepID=UPI002FF7B942